MREIRQSGSVEGVMSNHDSYSDMVWNVLICPRSPSRKPAFISASPLLPPFCFCFSPCSVWGATQCRSD